MPRSPMCAQSPRCNIDSSGITDGAASHFDISKIYRQDRTAARTIEKYFSSIATQRFHAHPSSNPIYRSKDFASVIHLVTASTSASLPQHGVAGIVFVFISCVAATLAKTAHILLKAKTIFSYVKRGEEM